MKNKKIIILIIILINILNISKIYAISEPPELLSETAILIDSSSNKIIYSKKENDKMYPASTTKILTAILTIENCNLEETITVPNEAIINIPSGYTIASLQAGEELTIMQLLQVMLVYSANDAANVLAYHISGSIDNFANLMNNKISELGLKNTHFTNPSGMHDENHYTTAYDLAIIMKYCMKNPTFRNISNLKSCTIPSTNKNSKREFTTTNELLINNDKNIENNYYYKYAIAGKTGFTTQAQNCLVSVSIKDNLELICVVLSAGLYHNNLNARFVDSKKLFEYGYNNYTLKKIIEQNTIVTQIEVANGSTDTNKLDLLASNDITALISQDILDKHIPPKLELKSSISAPISQGEILGKLTYTIDEINYSTNLIASHNVEKSNMYILILRIVIILLILYLLYKLLFGNILRKNEF